MMLMQTAHTVLVESAVSQKGRSLLASETSPMATLEELARRSIVELVQRTFEQRRGRLRPISYDELARRIRHLTSQGRPVAIAMGDILSISGRLLAGLGDEWGAAVPQLTALAVAKAGRPDAGLPSEGMREFWPTYPQMTRQEKERKAQREWDRIASFGSRWNDVLGALELPEVEVAAAAEQILGAGGESQAHLDLKTYVSEHPECVGAKPGVFCHIEYPLPSGDEIDVFFKSAEEWLAVEVKAGISDQYPRDYERGLYQAIKYAAVLEAVARADPRAAPSKIRSVLVLQASLPPRYHALRDALGVEVLENVGAGALAEAASSSEPQVQPGEPRAQKYPGC